MKLSRQTSKTAPDGGYGWVVVTCSGIIVGIMESCFKCIGQVFEAMVEKTTLSRLEISVACILPSVTMAAFIIIGTKIGELYSYRATMFFGVLTAAIGIILSSLSTFNIYLFTLTFGLFTGVGCGLVLPVTLIVTGLYFTKRRSFAIGLMLSLSNVTGFFMPLLLQYFFDQYQLKGGLLVWAGIWLQGCIAALLIRHPKWTLKEKSTRKYEEFPILTEALIKLTVLTEKEEKLTRPIEEEKKFATSVNEQVELKMFKEDSKVVEKKYSKKNVSKQKLNCVQFTVLILKDIQNDCRHFHNYVFILLLIGRIFEIFGFVSSYLILPQFIIERNQNITHTQVAFLLSLMSIGDILCRPVSGWIMSVIPHHGKFFYMLSLVLVGVSQVAFQFAQSYTSFIICSIIFGIFNGYTMVAYFNAIFEIFGPNQVPGVIALHNTFSRLFTITSAPITTVIRNQTGSYSQCLTLIGVFNFATVLLWSTEQLCFRNKQNVV